MFLQTYALDVIHLFINFKFSKFLQIQINKNIQDYDGL
jgi:hypothetical protein